MAALKIPGAEIDVGGGRTLVFAPLNAAAYRQHREAIQSSLATLMAGGLAIDLTFIAQLAHLSLARNYPEITVAEVEDFVDMANGIEIFSTVMHVSGLMASVVKMMREVSNQAQSLLPASSS